MFKVIVTGGKDFKDLKLMEDKLDKLFNHATNRVEIYITDRRGAEKMVKKYAFTRDIPVHIKKVNWDNGRYAGVKILTELYSQCDAIVIFDNGEDSYTQSVIRNTESLHIQRRVIRYEAREMWSQQPATAKQLAVIGEICKNNPHAPAFTGSTTAEAGIYIRRYY